MNILCFQEGVRLNPNDLTEQLSSESDNVADVLKRLELSHVLKHRIPKIDVNDILFEVGSK